MSAAADAIELSRSDAVFALWRKGLDTKAMAELLRISEAEVYSLLIRRRG